MNENEPVTISPTADDAGYEGQWQFGDFTIEGVFLGVGSSRTDRHSVDCRGQCAGGPEHHGPQFVHRGHMCGGCRWFEIRLFALERGYAIVTARVSAVPEEQTTFRLERADTAVDVLDLLAGEREVRDSRGVPIVNVHNGIASVQVTKFWSWPARGALSQAAEYDDPIYDAYAAAQRNQVA